MKAMVIGASLAALALPSTTPPALAGSDDVYFWCWKQADYVRPVLMRGEKEAWVANCVADHTPPLATRKKKRY
ncbi:MAG TPA: hypothetical protein VFQ29_10390 [Methyloceanibacter sp.]|jgi:hypothetical protein|nr:hypothetical protein [Methyloceanibacter sp.]